jgi:hypothetical protein
MTMKRMSEREIQRWGRIRARGLTRFIALETITYGLIAVVATIAGYSLEYVRTGKHEFSSRDYLFGPIFTVVFALYRFFRGHFRWIKQEDRYRASVEPVDLI